MSDVKLLTEAEWRKIVVQPYDATMRELRERGLIAPEPVDPLLLEAREICGEAFGVDYSGAKLGESGALVATYNALKRGMELAPAARPLTREMVREALEADGWIFQPPADKALFDRLHAALTEGQSK